MLQRTLSGIAVATIALGLAFGQAANHAAAQGVGTPVTLEGEFEIVHADDFERGRSDTFYFLRDSASGLAFELTFDRPPSSDLSTGDRVQIRGLAFGRRVQVSEMTAGLDGGDAGAETQGDAAAPTVTERRAVVLMVDLQDAKASSRYTLDQVTQNMFTGSRSTAGVIQSGSYGQMTFPADTDQDGSPDVFGPFLIDYDSTVCDYYGWASAADAAAEGAGVDLSLYQHRVYILPRYNEISCNWAGLANVGCASYCRAWIAEGESPMVYTHEVGHNLYQAHAGTDPENDGVMNAEYGDYSDPMGLSRNWHVFNAPHADQMGWFQDFPGAISDVLSGGIYDIAPMTADPATTGLPLALRIAKPDSGEYYYLSYRQRQGYDDSLSPVYTQGVNIHRYRGAGYSYTYFIDSLADFESFEDANNAISVTQLSHASDRVTVEVVFDCAARPPTVALTPSPQATQPGGDLVYTVSVTNQDFAGCEPTDFALLRDTGSLASSLVPDGFTLAIGETQSATLTVAAGATDGSYGLQVEAIDSDGLEPVHDTNGLGSATAQVDGTAPTTPTGLVYSIKRKTWANLTWTASNDAVSGVSHYSLYRDGAYVGATASTSYTDKNYVAGVSYTAVAVDNAGNASRASDTAIQSGGKGGGGNGGGGGGGNGKGKNK